LLWRTPSYDYLPVVVNNVLYITSQAGLSALQARDGTLLWRYALADTGFSGPTIVDGVLYTVAFKYSSDTTASTPTAGYRLVTAPLNWKMPFKQGGPSSLYALRANNGTVLWHYQTPGGKNNGMGVLAATRGLVYIVTYIDTVAGQSKGMISALRAGDGSLLWTYQRCSIQPGSARAGSHLHYFKLWRFKLWCSLCLTNK
jgi:outer membrane protein assembly factor BamB